MPYREDEDAALARADALQSDLDRAQAELTATKARLADTERERDRLAEERAALARDPAPVVVRIPPRWDFRRNVLPLLMVGAGLVFLLILIFGMQASRKDEAQMKQRAFEQYMRHADLGIGPECTIYTVPEGAQIVAIAPDGATVTLGITPFARRTWVANGDAFEALLEGYAPLAITAPVPDSNGECTATYPLQKQ